MRRICWLGSRIATHVLETMIGSLGGCFFGCSWGNCNPSGYVSSFFQSHGRSCKGVRNHNTKSELCRNIYDLLQSSKESGSTASLCIQWIASLSTLKSLVHYAHNGPVERTQVASYDDIHNISRFIFSTVFPMCLLRSHVKISLLHQERACFKIKFHMIQLLGYYYNHSVFQVPSLL